jgi:hypothetical protein
VDAAPATPTPPVIAAPPSLSPLTLGPPFTMRTGSH